MIRRNVQRLKIVPVVLDFGSALDGEARAAEQRLDAASRTRRRMQRAGLLAATRLRDIDATVGEPASGLRALELCAARLGQRDELITHCVDARAGAFALARLECAQRLEHRRDRALLAEE